MLEGEPSLRTAAGWRVLAPGEVVSFPRGEQGAHQIAQRDGARPSASCPARRSASRTSSPTPTRASSASPSACPASGGLQRDVPRRRRRSTTTTARRRRRADLGHGRRLTPGGAAAAGRRVRRFRPRRRGSRCWRSRCARRRTGCGPRSARRALRSSRPGPPGSRSRRLRPGVERPVVLVGASRERRGRAREHGLELGRATGSTSAAGAGPCGGAGQPARAGARRRGRRGTAPVRRPRRAARCRPSRRPGAAIPRRSPPSSRAAGQVLRESSRWTLALVPMPIVAITRRFSGAQPGAREVGLAELREGEREDDVVGGDLIGAGGELEAS